MPSPVISGSSPQLLTLHVSISVYYIIKPKSTSKSQQSASSLPSSKHPHSPKLSTEKLWSCLYTGRDQLRPE
jgi:hypothetical protein